MGSDATLQEGNFQLLTILSFLVKSLQTAAFYIEVSSI